MTIIVSAIVVIAVVVGVILLTGDKNTSSYNPSSNPPTTTQNQEGNSNTQTNTPTSGKISSSELSSHNVQSDCWVAYKGKVYDLTSWLPKHPGSAAAIAPYCGTSSEFEQAFSGQHGTSQVEKLTQEGVFKGELG